MIIARVLPIVDLFLNVYGASTDILSTKRISIKSHEPGEILIFKFYLNLT